MVSTKPTRQEYEADICSRWSVRAVDLPFEAVSRDTWAPKIADCHNNVDRWVELHPGYKAVRGWTYYMRRDAAIIELTAHSVVCGPDGRLFDITPVSDLRCRGRFVEHKGDDAGFFEMEQQNRFIRCQDIDEGYDAALLAMAGDAGFSLDSLEAEL